MSDLKFPELQLTDAAASRVQRGHQWIFSNEVAESRGTPVPGGEVAVFSAKKEFLGTALYGKSPLIVARLFSKRSERFSAELLAERIGNARQLRETLTPGRDARRVVFSESDLLPGLIVDQYGPVLSVQFLTLAMDQRREMILDELQRQFAPAAIVERNDTPGREHENLPQQKGVLRGSVPEDLTVNAGGVRLGVDPVEGQKTGLYLDQIDNWQLVRPLAPGRKVLDLFCNVGGFGLTAAQAGAASVRCIDSSEAALSQLLFNAERNGLTERVRAKGSDGFLYVRSLPDTYDLIICDPPPFARSRKQLESALRGYRELNRQCIKLLQPGGILITCSCSAAVGDVDFDKMLTLAARDAGRMMRLLPGGGQPADHAPLLAMPETQYLKIRIVQALD